MHITDPIADMLTRIRNANSAKHDTVDVPASNMKKAIAQILLDEGYIKNFQLIDDGTAGRDPHHSEVQCRQGEGHLRPSPVSKPGLRVYAGADELPRVLRGLGIADRFHVQGRHDRQEGPRAARRRRSPGVCLVRRVYEYV